MRQKTKRVQPLNTVHKDIARYEFARAFNPDAAEKLRLILEANKREKQPND